MSFFGLLLSLKGMLIEMPRTQCNRWDYVLMSQTPTNDTGSSTTILIPKSEIIVEINKNDISDFLPRNIERFLGVGLIPWIPVPERDEA